MILKILYWLVPQALAVKNSNQLALLALCLTHSQYNPKGCNSCEYDLDSQFNQFYVFHLECESLHFLQPSLTRPYPLTQPHVLDNFNMITPIPKQNNILLLKKRGLFGIPLGFPGPCSFSCMTNNAFKCLKILTISFMHQGLMPL